MRLITQLFVRAAMPLCVFTMVMFFTKCQHSGDTDSYGKVSIKPVDTLSFILPDYVSPRWDQIIYHETDSGNFAYVSDFANRNNIYQYKIGSDGESRIVHTIRTHKEGPDGVGTISGFYVHNDSIFVVDDRKYSFSIINHKGALINQFRLINGDVGLGSSQPDISSNAGMVKVDDVIYMATTPDVNPSEVQYKVNTMILSLNLKSGQVNHFSSYPKYYKQQQNKYFGIEHNRFSFCLNKDKTEFVYSFAADNSIQKASLKNLNSFNDYYDGSSPKLDEYIKPLPSFERNLSKRTYYQLTNDIYKSIIYDHYRDIYYRFYVPKYEKEDAIAMQKRKPINLTKIKNRGAIVFDKGFEKLADVTLPQGISIHLKFLTKDGLFLKNFYDKDENRIEFVKMGVNL